MKNVYPKKCPHCGNEFIGSKGQVFCGHRCANRGRRLMEKEEYDHDLIWVRDSDKMWICPYEENVCCRRRKCNECGWHPEVAKERLEAIVRKMAMEE